MWPNPRRDPGRHPRIVRPYVLTRGRTHAAGPVLPLETGVRAVTTIEMLPMDSAPESRRIVELCQPSLSLAELAARLMLPVGVVRVLVADLVEASILMADDPHSTEVATDLRLLERLLDGIRAL
jgi:uncharacterized protein DUF742